MQKIKLLLLSILSIGFFQPALSQDKYTITVTLPTDSMNGCRVLLRELGFQNERGVLALDSTTVVNRTFRFTGIAGHEPVLAEVTIRSTPLFKSSFILESGDININFEERFVRPVTGTPLNEDYYNEATLPHELVTKSDTLGPEKMRRLRLKTWTQEDERAYMKTRNVELLNEMVRKDHAFIGKYIKYPKIVSHMLLYIGNKDVQDKFIQDMPEPYFSRINSYLADREVRFKELKKKGGVTQLPEQIPDSVAIGQVYTDFVAVTSDGDSIQLSDILKEGKITVLDFWASWCGPCLKEMPFMNTLHEEFGDQGVSIVGVSIDKDEASWKKSLSKHNMPWLQIKSLEAPKTYYVNSIPYVIIIDEKGTIVSRRLRGEPLKNKIIELLKK